MNPIEFLKKTNTVLVFFLLVVTIAFVGDLMIKSRKPLNTVHIAVDSIHIHKK